MIFALYDRKMRDVIAKAWDMTGLGDVQVLARVLSGRRINLDGDDDFSLKQRQTDAGSIL